MSSQITCIGVLGFGTSGTFRGGCTVESCGSLLALSRFLQLQTVDFNSSDGSFVHEGAGYCAALVGLILFTADHGSDRSCRAVSISTAADLDRKYLRGFLLNAGRLEYKIRKANPYLPIALLHRLRKEGVFQSFVSRLYSYNEWLRLDGKPLSYDRLLDFYGRHKYLLMAHDVAAYQRIGPKLAHRADEDPASLASELMADLVAGLKRPARRGSFANALQHIRGYLKRQLAACEKKQLDDLIDSYRLGQLALPAVLDELRRAFSACPQPYIDKQLLLQMYAAP